MAAEYDDLRPSAELLAQQLADAGTKSSTYLAKGMTHGHLNRFPSLGEVDRSLHHFAALIRSAVLLTPEG
jgi:acetyl esterase